MCSLPCSGTPEGWAVAVESELVDIVKGNVENKCELNGIREEMNWRRFVPDDVKQRRDLLLYPTFLKNIIIE